MPKERKVAIGKLSFVNLYSRNFDKLIQFYRDVLGLEALPDNKKNWFGFNTGEITFALEPYHNRKAYEFEFNKENPLLLQFQVKSVDKLKMITKILESKRVNIKQRILKKSYGTITTFVDPDNNVIELLVETK